MDNTLSAGISELNRGGVGKFILLPEWRLLFINMDLGDLESHVFVRDLGDVGEEEDACEYEDEDSKGEVHPLDALESGDVVCVGREEGVQAQDRPDDRAVRVESLCEADSDFRVSWRAANYAAQYLGFVHNQPFPRTDFGCLGMVLGLTSKVRVCSRLEGSQARANVEGRTAEASK